MQLAAYKQSRFQHEAAHLSRTKLDPSEGSSGRQHSSDKSERQIKIKKCKLRRTRFVNAQVQPRESRVGGGKHMRKSHVKGPQASYAANPKMSVTASVNHRLNQSLSDIDSIDSGISSQEQSFEIDGQSTPEQTREVPPESRQSQIMILQ